MMDSDDLCIRRANAEALRVISGDRLTPRMGQVYYITPPNREKAVPVHVVSVSTNGTTVYATWRGAEGGQVEGRFCRRWSIDHYRWLLKGQQLPEYSLMGQGAAMVRIMDREQRCCK